MQRRRSRRRLQSARAGNSGGLWPCPVSARVPQRKRGFRRVQLPTSWHPEPYPPALATALATASHSPALIPVRFKSRVGACGASFLAASLPYTGTCRIPCKGHRNVCPLAEALLIMVKKYKYAIPGTVRRWKESSPGRMMVVSVTKVANLFLLFLLGQPAADVIDCDTAPTGGSGVRRKARGPEATRARIYYPARVCLCSC